MSILQAHTLAFDAKIYSVESIQKAAYCFIDRLAAVVSLDGDEIRCVLTPDIRFHPDNYYSLLSDFSKEVLDQHLRAKIKAETEQVRNLILSYAFSKSGLQS